MCKRHKSVKNGHAKILFMPSAPYETPEEPDRICEECNRATGNYEIEPRPSLSVSSIEGAFLPG